MLRWLIDWLIESSRVQSCPAFTESLNHGQSNSAMATTRMETIHGLIYSMARAIDITAWQSVDAICLCCLTHGACVKVTGLHHNSEKEATSSACKKKIARVLSSVNATSTTCRMCWTSLCAACFYIIARPDSQFLCTLCTFFGWSHIDLLPSHAQ